jgi:hypothetical protein
MEFLFKQGTRRVETGKSDNPYYSISERRDGIVRHSRILLKVSNLCAEEPGTR